MPDDPRRDLQEVVDSIRIDTGVPGIAAGVLLDGDRLIATSGVANAESGHAVVPATMFQVGSISKTFTGALVMLCAQEGLLALDDPIAKYLPALDRVAPNLMLGSTTVEQTLSHTAGFDGDHLLVQREGRRIEALADARRLFEPGRGWSYSNAGFTVAGAVVEAVTAQPFEQAMRSRVLAPLGITGAYRADDVITRDVAAPHWVHGTDRYVIRGAGWQPGWELEPLDHAPGGLIASVEDLLVWCGLHLDGRASSGQPVLSSESLTRLHTPVVQASREVGIGLDWFVKQIAGATVMGHGGVTAGYVSDLLIVPSARLGVVVCTNSTGGAVAITRIRRWVLAHLAGLVETDPVDQSDSAPDLAAVCGRYGHAFGMLTVEAGPTPASVVVRTEPRRDVAWQPPADPPALCRFSAPDTIFSVDGEPRSLGRFTWGGDGRAASLTWHERMAPRID